MRDEFERTTFQSFSQKVLDACPVDAAISPIPLSGLVGAADADEKAVPVEFALVGSINKSHIALLQPSSKLLAFRPNAGQSPALPI